MVLFGVTGHEVELASEVVVERWRGLVEVQWGALELIRRTPQQVLRLSFLFGGFLLL